MVPTLRLPAGNLPQTLSSDKYSGMLVIINNYIIVFLKIFFCAILIFHLAGCPQTPLPPKNFSEAKKVLQEYIWVDNPATIYCRASYNENKEILLPEGFITFSHISRASKMEWEHAVPAENFGRAFSAWREGHPSCIKNGQPFKGRRCAEKVSATFRKMESDMYNLFPSIGAVNAARKNRQYAELPNTPPSFGSCEVKIDGNHFEPPAYAKGQVARASLYMDQRYDEFRLSHQQIKLFSAWNKKYPPDSQECERAKKIAKIQGNENSIVQEACKKAGID